jgi:hypothetical protein
MTNTANNAHGFQRPTRRAAVEVKAKITKNFAQQKLWQEGVAVRPKKTKKKKVGGWGLGAQLTKSQIHIL